ncbi:NEGR1.2 family protein [Megaselia abdita]
MRAISLLCVLAISVSCVLGGPKITSITEETIVSEGDSVDFNCTVKDHGTRSLEWKKTNIDKRDDSEVLLALRDTLNFADPRYTVKIIPEKDGVVIYHFNIKGIEASDMGHYVCSINLSQKDKITSSVNLYVKHSPIILETKTLKTHVVTEGYKLEALCQADGYPKPTISWKRENNAIMPGGGQVFNGNTLKIKETHRLDRGNYFCIADNKIGQPVQRIVRIDVEFAPTISIPRPKVAQAKGYSTDLECNVQGYPAVSVTWHKDGEQLQSGGNYEISNTANSHETTNSVLTISSISGSDYGDYFCNATNKLGQIEARLNLFEPVVPIPTRY